MKTGFLAVAFITVCFGCNTAMRTAPAPEPAALPLPASTAVLSGKFATAPVCAECHSNHPDADAMRGENGEGVAPYDLWSRSMMAHAARDPFWLAVVSAEVAATPSKKHEIEMTCMRCHTPMAAIAAEDGPGDRSGTGLLHQEGDPADLARDGVSCTLCHQLENNGFGGPKSFSGLFEVGDGRKIYGPHRDVFPRPMMMHTGYTPGYGEQILDPGLCATCHTLFTSGLDPDGEPAGGILPEQTPYLEWKNSRYAEEGRTCQDCHMAADGEQEIETAIARTPHGWDFGWAEARRPYGLHRFLGANTAVPQVLAELQDEFHPVTDREGRDRQIDETVRYLSEKTARLVLGEPRIHGRQVTLPVTVQSIAGHRFPTGHPSRRAWIRFRVLDGAGTVVFASGEFDDLGRLLDREGSVHESDLPGNRIHIHRDLVSEAGQAQVYESVMEDSGGSPTWLLTRGVSYIKDNRILPEGWSGDHADAARIGPAGIGDDPDFAGGSDTVRYRFTLPGRQGPYTVEVGLWYQALGARFVAELLRTRTPEVDRFRRGYEAARPGPVRVVAASTVLDLK